MTMIGRLHPHTLANSPPESSIVYWRVQVTCDGVTETLLFTESDLKKVRDRAAKHPGDAVPVPEPRKPSLLDQDPPEPPSMWSNAIAWVRAHLR